MTLTLGQLGGLFTAPALAAAGVAAVSVPIAIHLLWRLRRRPQAWGAMRFLEAAYRRHKQRLRFEQWLLLMVRCLILAVLGFALAGPLLGGAAAQWVAGLETGGRVVHVVIDDALPSRAVDPAGEQRFERLRERALAVIDALGPADRAAVWRSARPAGPVVAEPTSDRAALRRAIEGLEPRASRPNAVAALRQVNAALEESEAPAGRVNVIVLDSFSESATYLDEPAPAALRDLGERAGVWATEPAADAANVQVENVEPHRRMVLVSGDRAEVPVRLTLRRFDRDLAAADVALSVRLKHGDGTVLASAQRDARFAAGERRSALNLSLAVSAQELALDEGAAMLVLEARLDGDGGGPLSNQLAADDRRLAIVELRSHMSVGLVAETGVAAPTEAEAGLRPAQWLTLALDPTGDGRAGGVRLEPVTPGEVSHEVLAGLDAAAVVRPELLSDEAWGRLAAFAEDGGLVWVFVPPVEAPATWTRELIEAFDLDWRIGLEPITSAAEQGAVLESEGSAPGALPLLASDWSALLRPVRVMRRLPMAVEPEGAVWLRVTDGSGQADDAGEVGAGAGEGGAGEGVNVMEGSAVLAHRDVGAGALLVQATALETGWTNLPTKPLFVPLMHEGLRGVLGAARDRIEPGVVAGDEPTFGPAWAEVARLEALAGGEERAGAEADDAAEVQPVALRSGARDEAEDGPGAGVGARASAPLERPGVYGAAGGAGGSAGLKLAVNVDADAGDTRSVMEQRVRTWLNALGGGELLDETSLASMFEREAATVNISWPLLWVVAVLVVLETLLARWLSHAHRPGRGVFGGRGIPGTRFERATSAGGVSERGRAA